MSEIHQDVIAQFQLMGVKVATGIKNPVAVVASVLNAKLEQLRGRATAEW